MHVVHRWDELAWGACLGQHPGEHRASEASLVNGQERAPVEHVGRDRLQMTCLDDQDLNHQDVARDSHWEIGWLDEGH